MTCVRILSGSTERIQTPALKDGTLSDLTGLSTVVLGIQRTSDNFWYDFDDDTFKNSGWTTRQQQMTEVDATLAPGEYRYDWDTSGITNETADDTYMLRVDETGGSADNVPMTGEIKVDQWPRDILDDTSAIDARLPSDPADESSQTSQHTATQAAISALNDPTAAAVADAVWDEALAGHVAAGSTGEAQGRLDATVSSRSTQADILSDATPFAGANVDATISSRSSHSAASAADAVWDEAIAGHVTGGSFGSELQGKAEPGDQMDLLPATVSGAVDDIWDEALAGHLTPGTTGEALSNAGGGGVAPTAGQIADAVWDEAIAGHTDPGSTGELQSRLDATVSSRSIAGDAMDLIAGAVDANALDATAVAEIADGVWDEQMAGHTTAGSSGQQQNRLDVDVSSRSAPGDAMDLVSNAVDGDAVASTGAAEIGSAVWEETLAGHTTPGTTGEAQNRLDAAISTRSAPGDAMSLTAPERASVTDAIWDEPTAGHTTAGTTGQALLDAGATADPGAIADAVWDEAAAGHAGAGSMGELQNRLDVAVSTRAAPGAPMDLQSNAIDAASLDTTGLDAIADAIWDEPMAGHVAGGSAGAELQAKAEPGDQMDLIADAVDSTSLADSGRDKIVDQVWEETLADHSGVAGSTAEALDNVSAPASPAVIADAVWDEALAGHVAAGSAGEAQNRLDAAVTTRAAPGDAMDLAADAVDSSSLATSAVTEIRDVILSDGTPFPGANIDAAISSRGSQADVTSILADTSAMDARLPADPADESSQLAQHTQTQADIAALNDPSAGDVADAVWDESLAAHQAAGSTGEGLSDAAVTADPGAIADAVWDEAAGDHTAAGSMGEAQNAVTGMAAQTAKIDSAATVDPSVAVTGSLLDRLANKDSGKTYDQDTDSLEAIADRIG